MSFHNGTHTTIGAVHLYVAHLEPSLNFYQEILGLKILRQFENTAELTANGETALLILEENLVATPKQTRTSGLYHFALLLPSRKDLGAFLRHILKTGYPLQGASDHEFSEAIYLADIDGHGIEIYADRPSKTWTFSNQEIPLVSNPIDGEGLLQDGENTDWNGLPVDTVMGHIHLNVSDLLKAKTFYVDGIGFDITIPFRHQALFVSSKGYHHHMGLNTWNGTGAPAPDPNSIRMKHFTLLFPSEEERRKAVSRLKEQGVSIRKDEGNILAEDPSGNTVQLAIY